MKVYTLYQRHMALAYEDGPNWSFSYYKHFHYPFVVRDPFEFVTLCKDWMVVVLEHFKDTQSHQLLHNLVKFVIGNIMDSLEQCGVSINSMGLCNEAK